MVMGIMILNDNDHNYGVCSACYNNNIEPKEEYDDDPNRLYIFIAN